MGIFRDIIARFPKVGLNYAFAYGSGVKQQVGYESIEKQKNNVIDLVFCVKDPVGWHAENMQRHASHYSALRFLGPWTVMNYQEKLGAGVYCNTLVPLSDLGVTIKYGVVSRDHLLEDLLHWRHLYLAGRLHKPVYDIISPRHDETLLSALKSNLLSAFQVALLLLPERFSAFDLFHTIASLSYKGDFRMIFGENKQKAKNIVLAQENDFLQLYRPVMKELTDYVAVDFNAKELGGETKIVQFEQDKGQKAKEHHLRHVPDQLRKRLIHNVAYRAEGYADIAEHLATVSNLKEILQVSVNDIVWRSSITQSLKNILSAGLSKSLVYSYRKALKTFN